METTLDRKTNSRIFSLRISDIKKNKINLLHKYLILCLLGTSLPFFCSAQEDYKKVTEQRAMLNLNLERIEIKRVIANLFENESNNNLIQNELSKANLALMTFNENYPDRYFSELGPEKSIQVKQIEADFRTNHRTEIYKWEMIKTLENKYNEILGQWINIENTIQKRSDIIPNLIVSIRNDEVFLANEQSSIGNIIEIRSRITMTEISKHSFYAVNSNNLKIYQEIIRSLDTATESLIIIANKSSIIRNNSDFQNWKSQYIKNVTDMNNEGKKYNLLVGSYKLLADKLRPEYNFPIKPLFFVKQESNKK